MMSATSSILILEIAIVLLVIVCILLFLEWKRRKVFSQQLEQLLQSIDEQQKQRISTLTQLLENEYALDSSAAQESGEYMVEAEKQFMQQFVKQQIEKTTIAEFYQNLCGLLDQYLYFVPKLSDIQQPVKAEDKITETKPEPEISEPTEPTEPTEASEDDAENVAETEEVPESKQETEEEPGWGDAFAESGEEMDDEVKEGYEAEVKSE